MILNGTIALLVKRPCAGGAVSLRGSHLGPVTNDTWAESSALEKLWKLHAKTIVVSPPFAAVAKCGASQAALTTHLDLDPAL